MSEFTHTTVLRKEAVDALSIELDGHYIDGTFGRGGHSGSILERLGNKGRLYAIDKDPEAAKVAEEIQNTSFFFKAGDFSKVAKLFPDLTEESLDGVLLDLGVSSPQLDDASRGFSFMRDGDLDMRMNPNEGVSAKSFIAQVEYKELVRIISKLGEERFAKPIAKKILQYREKEEITTTKQLAEIVKNAVPFKFHVEGRHPATRTFQAIRMHLNQEMSAIEKGLSAFYPLLKKGGKLVVISFHSLEDGMIKSFVKNMKGSIPPEIPVMDSRIFDKVKWVGKVVRPSEKEILENPRARSALMRVVEKI